MKLIFVVLPIFVLWGCAAVPTTPEEFRAEAKPGGHVSGRNYDVELPSDRILQFIKNRSTECFQTKVHKVYHQSGDRGVVPYEERNEGNFSLEVRRTNPHHSEVTIRNKMSPRPINVPEEGIIVIVMDLTRLNPQKTSIRILSMKGLYEEVVEALNAWTRLQPGKCPDPVVL